MKWHIIWKIAKGIWIAYAWDQISLIEKCHIIDFENFSTRNISEFCIEIDWNVQIVCTNCLSLEYLVTISLNEKSLEKQ